ncbi:MAG: MFS transporter [Pelagimonas sp.]|jgi:MFS family permease|nr:MFS transporter [Pelagimonas sp.]
MGGVSVSNAGMTTLIANRNYRFFFSASALSNLGDGVGALAFPWLATLLTRDAGLIALVAFATRLPWFLFAIPVGAIVDRRDHRSLMLQADLFRLLISLGVVGLIAAALPFEQVGAGALWALSGLAFLMGCAEVVRDNAAQTMLPSVVTDQQLETANGQLWSIEQVMGSFVGPPLAGVLIALAVPGPFLLNAAVFGLSAWALWMIAVPPRLPEIRPSLWADIKEGWQYLVGHALLFRLAVMLGLMNALTLMALTVLILFSQEVLGLSATGHGILLTAGAAGGVVGGLLGPKLTARLGPQSSLHLALFVVIFPYAVIAVTDSAWLCGLALFLEMVAALTWNIVTVSYRQRSIPPALLGRVNAIYRFFGWGMMPFGALIGGWLVEMATPGLGREMALRLPFALASCGFVGLAIYGIAKLRVQLD